PGYASVVWASDSKRFAFNLQPGKAYQTAQFYQLDGNTWRKLDSLESNAAMFAPLERSMARQKKKLKLPREDSGWPIITSWLVRKWMDPSTALIYAHSQKNFEIKNETESEGQFFSLPPNSNPEGRGEIVRIGKGFQKESAGLKGEGGKKLSRLRKRNGELRGKGK